MARAREVLRSRLARRGLALSTGALAGLLEQTGIAAPVPVQLAEATVRFAPLFAAGVPGLVIAEFVVDTAGKVEDGTVGIVSSTAPLFTEAVRVALESASYIPAQKNGHLVRQLVQQPFEFSVPRPSRSK